jgi:predicted  nucleic acid-binding Zn-ribbon protein
MELPRSTRSAKIDSLSSEIDKLEQNISALEKKLSELQSKVQYLQKGGVTLTSTQTQSIFYKSGGAKKKSKKKSKINKIKRAIKNNY